MRPEFESVLNDLRGDRLSGATRLTIEACMSISRICSVEGVSLDQSEVQELGVAMVRAQPNMGPIWTLTNSLLSTDATPAEMIRICESTISHHTSVPGKVAAEASSEFEGRKVLTSSSSSAVFNALVKASSVRGLRVYICESRPMREGVIMARELSNLGVDVTVIADAALSRYSSKVDVMVAGSDLVNMQGVIGKIGVLHMGLSSWHSGTPFIVLSDSSKFVPVTVSEDLRSPDELLEPGATSVRAENAYFEEVPYRFIAKIITESGGMTGPEAAKRVSEVRLHESLTRLMRRS